MANDIIRFGESLCSGVQQFSLLGQEEKSRLLSKELIMFMRSA
jgi:hypothetical protein